MNDEAKEKAKTIMAFAGAALAGSGIGFKNSAEADMQAELAALRDPRMTAQVATHTADNIEVAHRDAKRGASAATAGLLLAGAGMTSLWMDTLRRNKSAPKKNASDVGGPAAER